jgi:hypothetical protein
MDGEGVSFFCIYVQSLFCAAFNGKMGALDVYVFVCTATTTAKRERDFASKLCKFYNQRDSRRRSIMKMRNVSLAAEYEDFTLLHSNNGIF